MAQNPNDLQVEEHSGRGWLNPSEIFENVIYYRWVFVTIFGIVFTSGAVYTLSKTPIYRADVLIQVESKQGNALGGLLGGGGQQGGAFEFVRQTPIPGHDPLARAKAIDKAIERVKRQYPQFFKE